MNTTLDNEMLTVGVFKAFIQDVFQPAMAKIDQRFIALDEKMMDGFTLLDRKIDLVEEGLNARIDRVETNLTAKIDEVSVSKADISDVLAVSKRTTRLEQRFA
ncbi:MAG TPA: hypothetical protein VFQ72_03160 [Candidatus Paceibacterota bacterium]|nr:hypothetical protein [Candidatus Paceibacterota bacterium]